MASESEWSCPIYCDDQEDVTYMSPCLHEFCLGCALRWVWQKPNCPLCRLVTTSILFSVWSDNDYLTYDIPDAADPSAEDSQDEQGAVGLVPRAQVGDLPPEVWADFFKSHPNSIRPLLLWLRQELEMLAEDQWWEVAAAEGTIVAHLCLYGLDEEVLVRQLQSCLPENAGAFVRQLTAAAAVRLCGRDICQHLEQQDPWAAWGEDDRPTASPIPIASWGGTPDSSRTSPSSSAGSDMEEEASTLEAALCRGPSRPPSVPIPAEQEEPGQAAAAAGPSAQACSRSPSAPGQDRNRSPREHWHPPKRRVPGPQDSPQPHKRPPHQRH